jgi:hypothetical protein
VNLSFKGLPVTKLQKPKTTQMELNSKTNFPKSLTKKIKSRTNFENKMMIFITLN